MDVKCRIHDAVRAIFFYQRPEMVADTVRRGHVEMSPYLLKCGHPHLFAERLRTELQHRPLPVRQVCHVNAFSPRF